VGAWRGKEYVLNPGKIVEVVRRRGTVFGVFVGLRRDLKGVQMLMWNGNRFLGSVPAD